MTMVAMMTKTIMTLVRGGNMGKEYDDDDYDSLQEG